MKLSKKEINQFYNELKEKAALSGYKSVGNSLYRFSSNNTVSTGTPAGVGPVHIGDRLEGWLEQRQVLAFNCK